MELAIIGGGNMGFAIAHNLLKRNVINSSQLLIIEKNPERKEYLELAMGCAVYETIDMEVGRCPTIILAVKPQNASETMRTLKDHLGSHHLLLSIMAGVSMSQLQAGLGIPSVVRIMPNTPAKLGLGMSVFFADNSLKEAQRELVKKLLKTYGEYVEVDQEDLIDAATAISGSGPAYLFFLAEQMLTVAQKLGFNAEQANLLVKQTLCGSTELWHQSSFSPKELRLQVTSPGGTTEAAIKIFQERQVTEGLQEGIERAYQRAKELAKNA